MFISHCNDLIAHMKLSNVSLIHFTDDTIFCNSCRTEESAVNATKKAVSIWKSGVD